MTRKRTILVLAFVALLAVGAPATTAALQSSDGLVVGGQHSTASDFNNAERLQNLSVIGSGESAKVALSSTTLVDGFEDGDTSEWSTRFGSQITATTTQASSGSYSGLQTDGSSIRSLDSTYTDTVTVSFSLYTDSTTDQDIFQVLNSSGDPGPYIAVEDNEWKYYGSSGKQSLGGSVPANTWVDVTLEIDVASQSYNLLADGATVGTDLSFDTAVSELSQFAVTNNQADNLYIDDLETQVSADNGEYVSANYSVSRPVEYRINTTVQNATLTARGEYFDGSSWVAANSTTISSSGNHTLQVPGGSVDSDSWRLNMSFAAESGDTTAELHDESILFNNHAPEIDDSSADSGDGRTRTLSINASDTEFSTAQSDELDVEFYLSEPGNDSYLSVGTDTLTSNGTASTSTSAGLGGEYEWYAVATDSYGASTQSATFSFQSPGKLYIRNETDAGQLVTSTNVTVQWFGSAQVYENTTDTGVVDMTTLPNGNFVVQADADGYYSRTISLKSLYQQESIYLLNENKSSVETRFRLNDPTGIFPSQTTIYVKKPIELNGSVEYRTVYADQFGTEGVTATLMDGARYRLHLEAPDGTTQDMGPYRADVSETVEIRPEGAAVNIDDYSQGWGTAASIDNQTLSFTYSDPEQLTDSVTVTVVERGNESNQLQPSETYTDVGNVTASYPLTANQSEESWLVKFDIERDGESYTVTEIVDKNPGLDFGLDQIWKTIFGVVALLVFAGIFSVLNVGIGAIMLGIVGGILWWTGWLAAATSGAAVVIYLFTAVVYNIYKTGGA